MTGDRLIRASTAAVVVAVAAFAAVVSFTHIYDLGRAHGQYGAAGRLLPLSVDGLIVAASLVLLHEARNGRPAPHLARVMLWLGVAATLGANAAYGAPYGPLGVLVSIWPAVAFVGSVELLMGLIRRARAGSGLPPRRARPGTYCSRRRKRGESRPGRVDRRRQPPVAASGDDALWADPHHRAQSAPGRDRRCQRTRPA